MPSHLEVAGQRRPVVLALELEEEVADPVGVDTGVGRYLLLERPEEGLLHQPAELQQRDLRLPCRIDVGEPAVAQLETDVEGEMEVVVAERINIRDGGSGRLELDVGERAGEAAVGRRRSQQLGHLEAETSARAGRRSGPCGGPKVDLGDVAHRSPVLPCHAESETAGVARVEREPTMGDSVSWAGPLG